MRPRRAGCACARPLSFTVRTPMHGNWPIIYLGSLAVLGIGLSCWGTRVLLRQAGEPRFQRLWQLVLTWVVPVVGALLVIEIYRRSRRRAASRFVTADEINPMLNQALRPLADGATRAAEGFIQREVFDAAVEHFTHHSDGGGSDGGGSHGGGSDGGSH